MMIIYNQIEFDNDKNHCELAEFNYFSKKVFFISAQLI